MEKIESQTLTSLQNIMNDGVLKYTKIITYEGHFSASYNTFHEGIVAMMSSIGRKRKAPIVTTDTTTNHNRPAFSK